MKNEIIEEAHLIRNIKESYKSKRNQHIKKKWRHLKNEKYSEKNEIEKALTSAKNPGINGISTIKEKRQASKHRHQRQHGPAFISGIEKTGPA